LEESYCLDGGASTSDMKHLVGKKEGGFLKPWSTQLERLILLLFFDKSIE
jgi:hypothetical protein